MLVPTADATSGAARHLEQYGPRLHHRCYACRDVTEEAERLLASGLTEIELPRTAGGRRTAAFFHPQSAGGILTELVPLRTQGHPRSSDAGAGHPPPPGASDGSSAMNDGAVVTVRFHGTLDSGEVFDSSRGRRPRTFVIGHGQLIPGFEAALRRMSAGERTTVRIEPADAYGEYLEDRVYEAPRDEAADGLSPGDEVQLAGGAPAFVVEVTDHVVRLDANHPLAGKALTFEIELISVR